MRQTNPEYFFKLNGYGFTHDADETRSKKKGSKRHHIPRLEVEAELEAHLFTHSGSRNGTILIAGHRGVGKTTIVHRVVSKQRERRSWRPYARNLQLIELNLAQDDINEKTILRLFAIELHKSISVMNKLRFFDGWNLLLRLLLIGLPLGLLVYLVVGVRVDMRAGLLHTLLGFEQDMAKTMIALRIIDRIVVPFLFSAVSFWFLRWAFWHFFPRTMERSVARLRERAEALIARMQGDMTTERSGGVNVLKDYNPFHFSIRRSLFQASAKPKEIELELIDILDVLARLDKRGQVLFLIDELDKLVPNSDSGIAEKDNEDLSDEVRGGAARHGLRGYANDQLRERQRSLAALFANLKHFLHRAQAKFIFIGGTDLYDTVMADTSNRDAYLSSIFNHVVYLPSFFKFSTVDEDAAKTSGLATTVERFIAEALTGVPERKIGCLESYRPQIVKAREEQAMVCKVRRPGLETHHMGLTDLEMDQAYTALQNMAVYLLFRSNAIPRKTIQVFERYVRPMELEEIAKLSGVQGNRFFATNGKLEAGLYLHLDGTALHAHALLAHMNRPLLSARTKYHRELNDKLLVSLTYILDHMHKFHSTSFSTHDLELAPETIALNRVPEFRSFLDDVMNSLTAQYIRHVNNGLYEYQFYKKTHHEISLLSRISDLDAAAMNFTLDESLPVKQHFNKRLAYMEREARAKESLLRVTGALPQAHLGESLGDLHFFDEEYQEALEKYRNAALLYERAGTGTGPDDAWNDPVQFHHLVRLALKEAHSLEKMRASVDAMVVVGRLCDRILDFLQNNSESLVDTHWRMLLLAMAYRPALVEKASRGSLTYQDFAHAEDFLEQVAARFPFPPFADRTKATLLVYLGSILHYSGHELLVIDQADRALKGRTAGDYYAEALSFAYRNGKEIFSRDNDIDLNTWVSDATGVAQGQAMVIANMLSKYADTLVLEADKAVSTGLKRRYKAFLFFDKDMTALFTHPQLHRVAYYMLLSARSFVEGVNLYEAVNQVKELFYYAAQLAPRKGVSFTAEHLKAFEELKMWCIAGVHRYNLHLDRVQRMKYAEMNGRGYSHKVQPSNEMVSYKSELLEVEFAFADLKLAIKRGDALEETKSFLEGYKSTTMLSFARCRYLILCLKTNWLQLDANVRDKLKLHDTSKDMIRWRPGDAVAKALPPENELATLISDSLHSAIQLTSIADLYGTSYMVNHTLRAWLAEVQGHWCYLLLHCGKEVRDMVRAVISTSFDKTVATRLDPAQFYATALEEYKHVVQTHRRGKPYKRILNQMSMLEDDYMANMYHFCCALERSALQYNKNYTTRIDNLRKRIDLLKEAWM